MIRDSLSYGELRHTPYGLGPAVVFSSIFFFRQFGNRLDSIAGPNIAQDLNLDLRTIGGLVSIIGILSLGGTLIVGWFADRSSRKRMAGVGMVVSGLASMVQSRATNTGTFGSSLAAATLGGNVSTVPTLSLLSDYYPVSLRGRIFAIFVTLSRAGSVVALFVVGLLVTVVGWRTTLLLISIPIIVLGVVVLTVLREPVRGYSEKVQMGLDDEAAHREDPPQSFGEGWRTVWSVRMIRRLFWAEIFHEIWSTPFAIFLPFVLADEYGLNPLQRSLFVLPTVIAGITGGFLGGGLIDLLGKRSPSSVLRVLGGMNALPTVGLLILATLPPLPIAAAGVLIITFGQTVVQPAFLSIYSQVIPAQVRSQGVQITNLASIPAQITLGLVFATIATTYGFGSMFAATIPFILIAALIMITAADFFEGDRRNAIVAAATHEEARKAQEEGRSKFLVCRGVNVFYEDNQVLFGVDFEVDEGEIVAVLGTNGAGKSTLLRAISGSHEASDGAIVFQGRDITHMPPHEIAARGVVHMPGGRGTFAGLSVEDNLKLATWLQPNEQTQLLNEAFELFPVLRERRSLPAGFLSGGEQQMLSLAQAFMARPKLLMIDELSLGLSPAVVAELLDRVKEIKRRGTTVIIVEQSVNIALTISERVVFMEKGEVRFVGSAAELLRRPDILRAVYVKGTSGALTSDTPLAAAARRQRELELSGSQTILEVSGVEKRFGGVIALDNVDLTLRSEEILGVIGPNGSGKTTLFDVISGYLPADRGTVVFAGEDVTGLSASERARLGLIRRFQDARIFPSLTVTEALLVAMNQRLESKNLLTAAVRLPSVRRAERRARTRVERLIEILELGAYRDKFVKELSTGIRRIVDIAWILATQPRVLLLDEPSTGIAQSEAESLVPLLRRVRHETGCSILLIEHDISLVSGIADELVAMASGRVVTRGKAQEVLNDDRVIESFLGASEATVRRSGVLE